MARNKINDLRDHLFETLERLKEGDIDIQTAKAMAQPISIPPMIQHIALMGMRLQQSLVAPTADNAISFVVWLASTIARNSTAVVGTAAAAAGTPARCNPAHTARCGLRCALETYIENKPGSWLESSTLHGASSQSIGLTLPVLRWAQGPRWRSHASLHEYLVHVAPIGSANAQSCTAKAREASGLEGRPLTARTAQRVLGESLAPAQEPTNNKLPTKISQQHARRHHHPMPILHATATRNETGAWPQDVVRLGI